MITEVWMIVISMALACVLLVLRSFIFRGRMKPRRYQVSIMTFGDDHRDSHDQSALNDWPSEIAVPPDFFSEINVSAEKARADVEGCAV